MAYVSNPALLGLGRATLVLTSALALSCFDVDPSDPFGATDTLAPVTTGVGPMTSTTDPGTDTGAPGTGDGDSTGADGSTGPGEPVCGDGMVEGDEQCDDGGESATCNDDCTPAMCGDGVVNDTAGEECDDGGETPRCTAECTMIVCGNGVVDAAAGEECDDGGETATCDADCTVATCGDGTLNATAGEECDDGGESASCDFDCTAAMCGDLVHNMMAGEECDDGADSANCDGDCTAPECGDGYVNRLANESCDDGNMIPGDGCTNCGSSCQLVNGILWCYNDAACGEACNDVCASQGLVPMADQTAWFNAQNDAAECTALAAAFGIVGTSMSSYTYACLEDSSGNHGVSTFIGPLLCSTYSGCPGNHVANMDQLGVDCASGSSRRSICPCE